MQSSNSGVGNGKHGSGKNTLYIVGIGPGDPDHLSKRASEVLNRVGAIAGYSTYIDLIRPLIENKRIISTAMKKEMERVEAAIDITLNEESCAIVSSGDPGIYAMAGLVFEICKERRIPVTPAGRIDNNGGLHVEVVPGIPALCSGASLLGAPLTHDFASISLSDLLTPLETIEKRIEAAAAADFVIVLYNPKSKKRTTQLERARDIILKYRDGNTPVGIVTSAMRKDQDVKIIPLGNLYAAPVNMQTTVFVGNSASTAYLDYMVTPRGYAGKYKMGNL